MVTTWQGPHGWMWQDDDKKQTGGPFETKEQAQDAGDEQQQPKQPDPKPAQPPRK